MSVALQTFQPSATEAVISGNSTGNTLFIGEYTGASNPTAGAFISLYSNDTAAMASGDRIGGMTIGGYDGSFIRNSAVITAYASGGWTG